MTQEGFPEIRHCVVCQEVKHKRGKPPALIGFYGIAPDATVRITETGLRLYRLTFFVMGVERQGGGTFPIAVAISDENGTGIGRKTNERHVSVPSDGLSLPISMTNLKFPHAGRYVFTLFVEGRPHYQTSFEVVLEQPDSPR